MTEQTTEIKLPSRIESIEETASFAAKVLGGAGVDNEAAFGMDLALREAVANAVLHGNKQDETKIVNVILTTSPATVVITVRDQGVGFDPGAVPDPTDAEHLLQSSGRGILFMRTFMDEVEWSRHPEGGTVVRMTKRR